MTFFWTPFRGCYSHRSGINKIVQSHQPPPHRGVSAGSNLRLTILDPFSVVYRNLGFHYYLGTEFVRNYEVGGLIKIRHSLGPLGLSEADAGLWQRESIGSQGRHLSL